MFEIPILFVIYKRLDTTRQVFNAIKKIKPRLFFIAADGPKNADEVKKCLLVREFVQKSIDWDCEVKKLFHDHNVGCAKTMSGAISWFFENVEWGVILEDDCLPSNSFFYYCRDMLKQYKNDLRVFLISGYNKQGQWNSGEKDYFFSNLGGIWGWASWRDRWEYFDLAMSGFDYFYKHRYFEYLLGEELGKLRGNTIYQEMYIKKADAWDYPWGFARHKNNGLAVVPSKNLVKNIGAGDDATHTINMPEQPDSFEIPFPLRTNDIMVADHEYDKRFLDYPRQTLLKSAVKRVKCFLKTF
jgi:hypothetical protein